MGNESPSPPPTESADSCTLKECYICELGKPIATDLLLNTISWTSILKLVLAVLHSSDKGRTKEYFSNNEITEFVYIHWQRISGSKKWSKEWKSRISDCLSHNKKSFESHERGKWRMKDMSQVDVLIDKLKRLHFQSNSTPLSPSSSPVSSPLITRSNGRSPSIDGLSPHSPPSPTIKDERSDNESPSASPRDYSSPHSPLLPRSSIPSSSVSMSSSPQSFPISPNPNLSLQGMEKMRRFSNSFTPSPYHGNPYLHINNNTNNESNESPPSSPVYISPRNNSTSSSHLANSYPYPASMYSLPHPSYQHSLHPPPSPPSSHFILPPPTPSSSSERKMHALETDLLPYYHQPSSPHPHHSHHSHSHSHSHSLSHSYSPRYAPYAHPADRDMVDLFNRKNYMP